MDAPEYLDLDEIDFTDDSVYSVTSLKNIPELSRRNDGQGEERQAPAINWSRGVSSHSGGGIKPTGIADVHSKFRPVKRVSPLKHQPETSDNESDNEAQAHNGEGSSKEEASDKTAAACEGQGFKAKSLGTGGALFGELEHYDLDMDEILDVPYIKSSQHVSTLPRVPHDKRTVGGGGNASDRCHGVKTSTLTHPESLASVTQYCMLSPVKWSDMRKLKSLDPDNHRPPAGGYDHSTPGSLSSSSASDMDKLLANRAYPETQAHKTGADTPGSSQALMFPLQGCAGSRQDSSKTWNGTRLHGECDDETKKSQNIINIIREGQISLLPHLAADNLELIQDEEGNNLLHISASQGHADCLQHLTSLMGEDCLNERNNHQLTPAGLGVKNGHLECVRWMVSETEAIAELSCSREHPSLIHYAARYGQEKVLLWLLQFMQEQAISLDEVDQYGNSAVHVAAQYGHLTCIQTLVEYGSNVTVQNQGGERPSQSAERQGHTTCARYLVVVETCMSLASQVVKLTKQLNEQATKTNALQNQVQLHLDPLKAEGTLPRSPSSHVPSVEAWPEMTLTAEGTPGDGHWILRQRSVDSDTVLRQLLGKDISDKVCTKEKLSLEFQEGSKAGPPSLNGANPGPLRRMGVVERRELKLARLKQIMQRSLSESDSDTYPPEEAKHGPPPGVRLERPSHLPIAESEEPVGSLHLGMKKHTSTTEHKSAFALSTSKSMDGYPSPTSDKSELDADGKPEAGGDFPDYNNGQKITTSPKSALKSPTSRRKTSQNLKLRVTFDEQVVHKTGPPESEPPKGAHSKEGAGGRTPTGSETVKRPFGTFRSLMESLSGNQNSNNNNVQTSPSVKQSSCGVSQGSPGRKTEVKTSPCGHSKGKSKASAV
ncbi:synphilin-1 isoform X1 [Oncorhynchus kisutch]|uniref:Synuclein, alpha interacting protein n=1 Tax=Oncorhynchus kisutch TaxID=8019 RepID=A0A8C7GR37_ONCKI|nr:synphilin-1 isoform X1 [Oncorhynchus kisutch]XP_031663769.1 synphilin-1 isoform X1 [Oncorhynchus kisutch]